MRSMSARSSSADKRRGVFVNPAVNAELMASRPVYDIHDVGIEHHRNDRSEKSRRDFLLIEKLDDPAQSHPRPVFALGQTC